MNRKNIIKILLDIVMALLLVLMFNKRVISMSFHEIGGLFVCGLFVVHMILNYKWIIAITKKFFSRNLKLKTRIGYLINFLLLLCMGFIALSGVFISKTILTGISSNNMIWKMGHQVVSGVALILIGIHVGLHWSFIKGMAKKVMKFPEKAQKPVGIMCLVLLIGTGIYSMATTSFTRWLTIPFTVTNTQQGNQGKGQFRGEHSIDNTKEGQVSVTDKKEMSQRERPVQEGKEQGAGERIGDGQRNAATQINQEISVSNILKVMINFLSIMATFATLTVWIEIVVNKFSKKKKEASV